MADHAFSNIISTKQAPLHSSFERVSETLFFGYVWIRKTSSGALWSRSCWMACLSNCCAPSNMTPNYAIEALATAATHSNLPQSPPGWSVTMSLKRVLPTRMNAWETRLCFQPRCRATAAKPHLARYRGAVVSGSRAGFATSKTMSWAFERSRVTSCLARFRSTVGPTWRPRTHCWRGVSASSSGCRRHSPTEGFIAYE